jgi:hypothetical protein
VAFPCPLDLAQGLAGLDLVRLPQEYRDRAGRDPQFVVALLEVGSRSDRTGPIAAAAKNKIGETSSQVQLRVSHPLIPAPPTITSTKPAPSAAVSHWVPRVT